MARKNIAVQFEQAEFYTLQEASDYLNLKHGISNITPKSILNKIISYHIPAYVFGKGFDLQCFLKFDFPDNLDTQLAEQYIQARREYNDNISDTISAFCGDDGLLLQLQNYDLTNIYMTGFLNGEVAFADALSLHDIKKRNLEYFHQMVYIKFDDLKPKEVIGIIPQIIYLPSRGRNFFDKQLQNMTLSAHVDEDFNFNSHSNNYGTEYLYLKITIDDLIILHKSLINLENNIINNNPAPQKNWGIQPKKGVSIQKLQAKEQAKTIAKALWNNDKEKKIRMLEMANLVYSELYKSDFLGHLPNDIHSLKDWIKDVAPPYASEAGRPPKE